MEDTSVVYLGLIGSLLAGLATGLGAIPIFLVAQITPRIQGVMLGFGAGVMLAATAFSLITPGLESASTYFDNQFGPAIIVSIGIAMGGTFLWLSNRYIPHEHFIKGPEGSNPIHLKRTWLFVMAIALHNFPEGLAVGVGFGGGDMTNALALTIGIALQNIPEGLVVALALVAEKYSRWSALGVTLLTGLVQPIGGVIGAVVVSAVEPLLPWGLAFAAGAMLFVISDEIIPESHRLGYEKEGTIGVMSGFVLMMFLDVTLG